MKMNLKKRYKEEDGERKEKPCVGSTPLNSNRLFCFKMIDE